MLCGFQWAIHCIYHMSLIGMNAGQYGSIFLSSTFNHSSRSSAQTLSFHLPGVYKVRLIVPESDARSSVHVAENVTRLTVQDEWLGSSSWRSQEIPNDQRCKYHNVLLHFSNLRSAKQPTKFQQKFLSILLSPANKILQPHNTKKKCHFVKSRWENV